MSVFPELHLEDLRAEVEPKALGRQLGERDRPMLDAVEDQGQSKISQFIAQKKNEAVQLRDERLTEVDKGLAELDHPLLPGSLESVGQQALAEFGDVEQRYSEDLRNDLQEWRKRREDFLDFKEENGISREPDYHDTFRRWIGGGGLFVLLLLESFLNAGFLAEGSEAGLFGGWAVAIGFSAVNILAPFGLFGPLSRYVRHVKLSLKIAGWACLSAWVGLALSLNLGLAHYREASEALVEDPDAAMVTRLLTQPFGMETAASWLLFVLGLGFSVLAFYEGWKFWGDSYPGYRGVHVRMLEAKEQLDDLRAEAADELKEVRLKWLAKAEETLSRARMQPAETRRLLKSEGDLLSAFEDHMEELRNFGSALIEEYRVANHAVRSDGAVPASHAEPWEFVPPSPHRMRTWEPRFVDDSSLAALQAEHVETVRVLNAQWEAAQQRLGLAGPNPGSENAAS